MPYPLQPLMFSVSARPVCLRVFSDEPSTGMDPVSRRFMWDVIADLSRRLSIVLTSHSLDEVEALCSRVGIMVNGGLACLGSIEHLKEKHGKGSFVELSADEQHMPAIRKFMNTHFPGSEEQEQHSSRIQFMIPRPSSSPPASSSSPSVVPCLSLSSIFSRIESHKSELGIHDYGVAQASLESIFVNIAKANNSAMAEARRQHNDKREERRRGERKSPMD
jgi:ABC-type multidrug transport system ATPase subunit